METTIRRPEGYQRLDDAVESFEQALQLDRTTDVRRYLPSGTSTEDLQIAVELLCVDLEYRHGSGDARGVEDYRQTFPEILSDPSCFGELVREDFRLRELAGESVSATDYATRFGIDTRGWQDTHRGDTRTLAQVDTQLANLRADLARITDSIAEMPHTDDFVAGCQIKAELGRGTFGVVYLAQQQDLEARPVVLKITAASSREPQHLARLQHTNIVPIYSLHRESGRQVICMPYFGRTTLAHVLRQQHALPEAWKQVGGTIDVRPEGIRLCEATVMAIARQLAAALVHGHARGIVHRDLKPANVLLADDGTAMLLDYNLSEDMIAGGKVCWEVGGTLPYMAPEHLQSIMTGAPVGEVADIYALGVLMFEMLTGRLPYPTRSGQFQDAIERSLADRKQPPALAGSYAADLSPGIQSIVARMVSPSRVTRYGSIAEVAEDLSRHDDDLPLKFAPNISWRERAAKWSRRHPRLTSWTSATVIAGTLVVGLLSALATNQQQLARAQSVAQLNDLRTQLPHLRAALSLPADDDATSNIAALEAERTLANFGLTKSQWQLQPSATAGLSETESADLRAQLAEYASLLDMVDDTRGPNADNNSSTTAWQAMAQALSQSLANDPSARDLQATLTRRLQAIRDLQARQFEPAAKALESLRDEQPYDISLWLLLGNAYAGLERWSDAEGCYTVCVTHWPETYVGYFYRGLVRLDQRNYLEARRDFTAALERRPEFPAAIINRAIACRELGDAEAALADLNQAIQADPQQPRLYRMRSDVWSQLKQSAPAAEDRRTALALTPRDERNWIEHGLLQLTSAPDQAWNDFQAAVQLNPNSWEAWRNLALVEAEIRQRPQAAIEILDRLIAQHPGRPADWVSRAVLSARQGDRDAALADAKRAWQLHPSAKETFQLACVYAQTSRQQSEDALMSVSLLEEAIRQENKWLDVARRDPDLDPLRQREDFQALLTEADHRQQRLRPHQALDHP